MKVIAAVIGLLAVVTSPASADWQYAKWGMTVDQLTAASKGQMKRCGAACDKQRTDTETALLYTPYQSGEFPFTAFAFFDNRSKQLAYMSLRLDDPAKGFQLLGSLKGKYGEPSSESKTSLSTLATWRGSGDQVSIFIIGGLADSHTTLTYRPRLTSSNKGL
jgi:hypothetical protein